MISTISRFSPRLLVLTLVFARAPFVLASDPDFARFLLPIHLDGEQRGANDTVWRDRFAVLNDSDRPLSLAEDIQPIRFCGAVGPCIGPLLPGRGMTLSLDVPPEPPIPAAIVWVRRSFAPYVTQAMNIYEQRNAAGPGTQIPIVAEGELRTAPFNLMVVELGAGRRSLLRLYELDAAPGAALRVRAYELEEGRLVADRIVPLIVSEHRFLPGYAQIPIDEAFFFLGTDLRFAFRIRIDPVVSGQQFWGMISVTNNTTNEFTLITPEP